MLTQSKKPVFQYLKKLMVLPIVAVAFLLFAFTYRKDIKRNFLPQKVEHKVITALKTYTRPDTIPNAPKKELLKKEKTEQILPKTKFQQAIGYYPTLPSATVIGYTDKQLAHEKLIPFTKIDKEAEFQGGNKEWLVFLERNIRGSVPIENGARAGEYKVFVQFTIDSDGSLSGFNQLTDIGYGMEEELVRVLKKSPKWHPAVNNKTGITKAVKAYRIQEMNFIVLAEDKMNLSTTKR